jgi:hypothetical protein
MRLGFRLFLWQVNTSFDKSEIRVVISMYLYLTNIWFAGKTTCTIIKIVICILWGKDALILYCYFIMEKLSLLPYIKNYFRNSLLISNMRELFPLI